MIDLQDASPHEEYKFQVEEWVVSLAECARVAGHVQSELGTKLLAHGYHAASDDPWVEYRSEVETNFV